MADIPLVVDTGECEQFRCIYIQKKTLFLNF